MGVDMSVGSVRKKVDGCWKWVEGVEQDGWTTEYPKLRYKVEQTGYEGAVNPDDRWRGANPLMEEQRHDEEDIRALSRRCPSGRSIPCRVRCLGRGMCILGFQLLGFLGWVALGLGSLAGLFYLHRLFH